MKNEKLQEKMLDKEVAIKAIRHSLEDLESNLTVLETEESVMIKAIK